MMALSGMSMVVHAYKLKILMEPETLSLTIVTSSLRFLSINFGGGNLLVMSTTLTDSLNNAIKSSMKHLIRL